jgi:dihydroorotase (multifunctional complex type)
MDMAYKEDFSTGTLAAAAGGFTTVLDMPNTKPTTDSQQRLLEKMHEAGSKIHVNVGFYGMLVESSNQLIRMAQAGAIAFKLYMNDIGPESWHRDDRSLLHSLEECGSLRVPVACHAESGAEVEMIQTQLQAAGKNSVRDFLKAHATKFEVEAIRRITDLAHRARSRVQVCHVSLRQSVREIQKARRRGAAVTCEATPHHLLLDRGDLNRKKGLALMLPPLRSTEDAKALWRSMLKDGIDMVASDHAPHSIEEKNASDIWAIRPGIPGLETTLPLLLTKANHGQISLSRIVRLLAEHPAKVFGLRGKGRLAVGMDGDVVLIDQKERFKIDSHKFHSKAHFSPFDGAHCIGRPVTTIVLGHVVYDHGEIIERNRGKVTTREVRVRDSSSTAC